MKFLVDEAISWRVAQVLREAGYDAVHVRDLSLCGASDRTILERAASEERVIVTQDTDFGTLLVTSRSRFPSVVFLRLRDGRPSTQAKLLTDNLPKIETFLNKGALVVLGETKIRIRGLPAL